MAEQSLPEGWDEKSLRALAEHYDNMSEEQQAAEDEAAWSDPSFTDLLVPNELVPQVLRLIAEYEKAKAS